MLQPWSQPPSRAMRPGCAGLDTTLEPAASYAVQTPRARVTVSERWNPVISDQLELDTCPSGYTLHSFNDQL